MDFDSDGREGGGGVFLTYINIFFNGLELALMNKMGFLSNIQYVGGFDLILTDLGQLAYMVFQQFGTHN